MTPQSNRVLIALVAALIVPRIEQLTGIKLTPDDVAALVGLAVVAAHGVAAIFTRYFPPPNSQTPAGPAKG